MNLQLLLNVVWTILGAMLVFFMQAGFAMVETGFTRAKNASNIIMKNLMDFVFGSIFFFIIGFGLMFGKDIGGLIGLSGFFNPQALADADGLINVGAWDGYTGLPIGVFMIFHTVFCATAATIVSGAMAERTKFKAYLLYSACISIFIYPVTGHWIWGGGWLSQLGFIDFAGSTAVHAVGGWCALVGAKILGPRLGKYTKSGKANAIPGHNIPLGALGVFVLWFAWFGFNCGSTVEASTSIGDIAMTTNLAAATATFATLFLTWFRYGKPDVSLTLNGSLAGLVAITAGCASVSYWGAFFIGLIAGVLVVFAIEFVEKTLKIDDPVGATGVHWACGCVGTLLVGLFATDGGVLYGGGFKLLGIQTLGVLTVGAYTVCAAFIIFTIINKTIGLRVSVTEEEDGLDVHEHGTSAYSDFQIRV